jgi:hypothetical protein
MLAAGNGEAHPLFVRHWGRTVPSFQNGTRQVGTPREGASNMATTADFRPVPASLAHTTPKVEAEPAKWHDEGRYLASTSGRLASGTLAFALLAAAGLACFGDVLNLPVAIASVTLACIVGGFLTIGLAMDRHGRMALALTLVLPPVAAVYFALLHVLPSAGIGVGVGFLVLAMGPMIATVSSRENAKTLRR